MPKYEVINGRRGYPTLRITEADKEYFIHSQYDPWREAQQLIEKYAEAIEQAEHIIFYGVGLGYHVKYVAENYPTKLLTTYEPLKEIAPLTRDEAILKNAIIAYTLAEDKDIPIEAQLNTIAHQLTTKTLLIVHPVYERLMVEKLNQFNKALKEVLTLKVDNAKTDAVFGARWLANIIMTIPYTLESPNFIVEAKSYFKGKSVLLVAAGPSLSEEIDNLKRIKEDKSAYIFSVGSANKELLYHGIKPDAVLSYDPQVHNYKVFSPIIENAVNDIPLVYGTSVGYETVTHYPGPLFHFVTSHDKLTQRFYDNILPVINDAYSIAIITLQILKELEVGKVILVGQNFAYKNSQYYASAIKHTNYQGAIIENKLPNDGIEVLDVYGDNVISNKSLIAMKESMESYIAANPLLKVVNTTNGGAQIRGTEFISLAKLIESLPKASIDTEWFKKVSISNTKNVTKELNKIYEEIPQYLKLVESTRKYFDKIKVKQYHNEAKIQRELEQIDRHMAKVTQHHFYKNLLADRMLEYFRKTQAEINVIQFMEVTTEKLQRVEKMFADMLAIISQITKEILPLVEVSLSKSNKNHLAADCGVFAYSEEWSFTHKTMLPEPKFTTSKEELEKYLFEKSQLDKLGVVKPNTVVIQTDSAGASFSFNIAGSNFVLYGKNCSEQVARLNIKIGQKEKQITLVPNDLQQYDVVQEIYKHSSKIKNKQQVTVTLLNDVAIEFSYMLAQYPFAITHVDEVLDMSHMAIGQRIRYHYQSEAGKLGTLTKKELTGDFISHETLKPNGEFYFIKVDEDKWVADRNLQSMITKAEIDQATISIDIEGATLRLLTGGYAYSDNNGDISFEVNSRAYPLDNEWDRYIDQQSDLYSLYEASWCEDQPNPLCCYRHQHLTPLSKEDYYTVRSTNHYSYHHREQRSLTLGYRPLLIINKN